MDKPNETERPLRVSFQGDANEEVHRFIVEQADALRGSMAPSPIATSSSRPPKDDGRYKISLYLTMPGDIDVCIDCHGPLDDRFCDPKFAVAEVFRHARQLIGSRPRRKRAGRQVLQEEVIGDIHQPTSSPGQKHR